MAGYMGSNKGTTGAVCDTAQAAADSFFAAYPTQRNCKTVYVDEGPQPGLVTIRYNVQAIQWKRAKGGAVNAQN